MPDLASASALNADDSFSKNLGIVALLGCFVFMLSYIVYACYLTCNRRESKQTRQDAFETSKYIYIILAKLYKMRFVNCKRKLSVERLVKNVLRITSLHFI